MGWIKMCVFQYWGRVVRGKLFAGTFSCGSSRDQLNMMDPYNDLDDGVTSDGNLNDGVTSPGGTKLKARLRVYRSGEGSASGSGDCGGGSASSGRAIEELPKNLTSILPDHFWAQDDNVDKDSLRQDMLQMQWYHERIMRKTLAIYREQMNELKDAFLTEVQEGKKRNALINNSNNNY